MSFFGYGIKVLLNYVLYFLKVHASPTPKNTRIA